MRRKIISQFIFISFALVIFSSCVNDRKTPPNKKKSKQEVDSFLNDWHSAASEADFEKYFSKMDRLSVFIGTDASENWTKDQFKEFSKPYFEKGKAWNFKSIERHIYMNSSKNFIWFDELLETWMGLCRGSGVIEVIDSKYALKHYVLSLTVPNEMVRDVLVIKREKDSILIDQLKLGS